MFDVGCSVFDVRFQIRFRLGAPGRRPGLQERNIPPFDIHYSLFVILRFSGLCCVRLGLRRSWARGTGSPAHEERRGRLGVRKLACALLRGACSASPAAAITTTNTSPRNNHTAPAFVIEDSMFNILRFWVELRACLAVVVLEFAGLESPAHNERLKGRHCSGGLWPPER